MEFHKTGVTKPLGYPWNIIAPIEAKEYVDMVKYKILTPVQAIKECRKRYNTTLADTHFILNEASNQFYGKDLPTLYNS